VAIDSREIAHINGEAALARGFFPALGLGAALVLVVMFNVSVVRARPIPRA